MTPYRTKLEAYEAGKEYGYDLGFNDGEEKGIAQERARAKKKLNPLYNRPVALKERVDREAEEEFNPQYPLEPLVWQGLGKTKQPSLWERFKRIISLKQYLM